MNKRTYASLIPAIVLIVITLILLCAEHKLTRQLPEQFLADRWSNEEAFSQVSCFFFENAGVSERQLVPLRYKLNEALTNAAVDNTNQSGRSIVDAYSSIGKLNITSQKASASVRALGVGGDFFLFHPMELLCGTYFDATDGNGDGVILDEDVAWRLFGSSQVDGMEIMIGNVVYPIRGVVRRQSGLFSEAAGEDEPTIYVAYQILQKDEEVEKPISNYELLIQSPVTGFGLNALSEALGMDESSYVMIENSSRFSIGHRLELLKNLGVRSMKTDSMVYPYWENRARAYEDVATLLLVMEGLCCIYPIVFLGRKLIIFMQSIKQRAVYWIKKDHFLRIKGKKYEKRK